MKGFPDRTLRVRESLLLVTELQRTTRTVSDGGAVTLAEPATHPG